MKTNDAIEICQFMTAISEAQLFVTQAMLVHQD